MRQTIKRRLETTTLLHRKRFHSWSLAWFMTWSLILNNQVIEGFTTSTLRLVLAIFAVVTTGGLFLVLLTWRADLKLNILCDKVPLDEATKVLLKVSWDGVAFICCNLCSSITLLLMNYEPQSDAASKSNNKCHESCWKHCHNFSSHWRAAWLLRKAIKKTRMTVPFKFFYPFILGLLPYEGSYH